MRLRSLFKHTILLLLAFLIAGAAHAQVRCEAIFVAPSAVSQNEIAGWQKLSAHLGYEPIVKKNPILNTLALVDPVTQKNMGAMEVVIYGKTLVIMALEVSPPYRRIGVSEALLEVALKSAPEVEVISTTYLSQDNARILNENLSKGMPLEEAIRQTPAYAIRAKFGFTQIVEGSVSEHSFQVRRP